MGGKPKVRKDAKAALFDVATHFRRWLRAGMTGCMFAVELARNDRLACHAFAGLPPANELDAVLDVYAGSLDPQCLDAHRGASYHRVCDRTRGRRLTEHYSIVAQAEKAEAVEALAKAILDGSGSTDCRLVDDQVDDGTNEVS